MIRQGVTKQSNEVTRNRVTGKKMEGPISATVKPLYYGHQGDRNSFPDYRSVRFREVGFIWISVPQGPSELSVIERCPYYRGVREERFHCIYGHS